MNKLEDIIEDFLADEFEQRRDFEYPFETGLRKVTIYRVNRIIRIDIS